MPRQMSQQPVCFGVYGIRTPMTPRYSIDPLSRWICFVASACYGPKQQNFEIIVINRKRSETSKTHQTHDTALFSGTVHSTSFLFTNRFSLSFSSLFPHLVSVVASSRFPHGPFRCFLIGNHNLGKLLYRSQTRI